MNSNSTWSRYTVISAVIIFIATILRLYNLGATSLWLDEAMYANNSLANFGDFIINTRSRNSSPIILPFLYWLLGDWVRDGFWVRVLPMLFGVLSVYILLRLPLVGISRWVAALTGLWVTVLPVQIQYSREVREYSLSVLVSCVLLFYFLKSTASEDNPKVPLGFLLAVALAPLASYGNIFFAIVVIFILALTEIRKERYSFSKIGLPLFVLIISTLLSYILTAQYQMGIAKAWYLIGNYPPDDFSSVARWLAQSNGSFIEFLTGGRLPGIISLISVCATTAYFIYKWQFKSIEFQVVAAFWVLLIACNILAFMSLYPFGGIRQHLFASPLVILTAVLSTSLFARNAIQFKIACITFLCVVILPGMTAIRTAYDEVEDIVSPVSDIVPGFDEQSVFVYYGARPAVFFHYPKKAFYFSHSNRGDIDSMVKEVRSLKWCENYLLFSHVYKNEDKQLIERLATTGYVTVADKKYVGSRLVLLNKCP